jgi:hypothetical protein
MKLAWETDQGMPDTLEQRKWVEAALSVGKNTL